MKLTDAIQTLNECIPHPNNKMVDGAHMNIAIAWQEIKAVLLRECYEQVIKETEDDDAELCEKRSKAVVLPCHIGDRMYIIKNGKIKQERVNEINMGNTVFRFRLEYTQYHTKDDIGKTVFFSKEEAEKMLQVRGNEMLVTK